MHVSVEAPPRPVLDALAPRGVMLFGRLLPEKSGEKRGERLIRLSREAGNSLREADLGPCRLGAALTGTAQVL
jgi:protein-L-isoaspartate(D-aspartate) O-methyltransferase